MSKKKSKLTPEQEKVEQENIENIRYFMDVTGTNPSKWAEEAGRSRAALQNYINRHTETMTNALMADLARAAGHKSEHILQAKKYFAKGKTPPKSQNADDVTNIALRAKDYLKDTGLTNNQLQQLAKAAIAIADQYGDGTVPDELLDYLKTIYCNQS